MERPRLVPQLYGYAVCLVGVITILIATGSVVDGLFDATNPEMSREVDSQLRTFETYKETRIERTARRFPQGAAIETTLPADDVLRRSYEDERRHAVARARYQGTRKIVTSILVLVVAAGFFAAHWRWLRGMARAETAAA